jgi:hypothetical protein
MKIEIIKSSPSQIPVLEIDWSSIRTRSTSIESTEDHKNFQGTPSIMKINIVKRFPSQIPVIKLDLSSFMRRTTSEADTTAVRGRGNGGPQQQEDREVLCRSLYLHANGKRKCLDREDETDIRSVKRKEFE